MPRRRVLEAAPTLSLLSHPAALLCPPEGKQFNAICLFKGTRVPPGTPRWVV